jgi:hypothetical protein
MCFQQFSQLLDELAFESVQPVGRLQQPLRIPDDILQMIVIVQLEMNDEVQQMRCRNNGFCVVELCIVQDRVDVLQRLGRLFAADLGNCQLQQ